MSDLTRGTGAGDSGASDTRIEQVVEGSNVVLPDYSGRKFTAAQIEKGSHRSFVMGTGGAWDEGGAVQLAFLEEQGLRPQHRVLDVGCGALRAGRHLIDYVDPGNYYGIDANLSLMQIGYERELTDAQRDRLPLANLRANDRFDADFGVAFDMAIANSVFTHVSLNHIQLCLYRLAKVMAPGGVFFASFIQCWENVPTDHIFQRSTGGRTYFFEKNVYWYRRSDLRQAAESGPWRFRFVGEYGSPQRQLMVAYTRMSDVEYEARTQAEAVRRQRAEQVRKTIRAGGARALVLRARRKAARLIDPTT